MTKEQKQEILFWINAIKRMMHDKGLCFAVLVDEDNIDNSCIGVVDADKLKHGDFDGVIVSLTRLNEGLI